MRRLLSCQPKQKEESKEGTVETKPLALNKPEDQQVPMEGYELEELNRQATEKVAQLEAEIQTQRLQHCVKWREVKDNEVKVQQDFVKFKKESESKYIALLEEKN